MWLRILVLVLAAAAALLLLASGPGYRLGVLPLGVAFSLLRYGAYAGIAAALIALIALCIPRVRAGRVPALVVALMVGAASAAGPLTFQRQARSVPPINDIRTDVENSPGATAKLQREAYPDIQPILLPVPPEAAFKRALAAAQAMGWELVAQEPAAGRIEAVDTTLWFGFKDDVVVRIAPSGGGSRVDVRSKSRVGRGDAGTNARRIRGFRERLS